ncbi:hypothetical protein [Thalassoglobus sp.]|uniref:hypothetical protein n=1 Tax=Thalassoglobus sp. TaxID=2795869 RepID=UPI003AA7E8F1
MTQRIMTNGMEINGTTGTVNTTVAQMVTVVAVRDLCVNVRTKRKSRRENQCVDSYCDPGKRLSKSSGAIKQDSSWQQSCLHSSDGALLRHAGDLPAAAWASLVISRANSYGAVSL